MANEILRYNKLLKIENENLQKGIEELKAKKEALRVRIEAAGRSANQRMQEFPASEATLQTDQTKDSERIITLEWELASKTSREVRLGEDCSLLESEIQSLRFEWEAAEARDLANN